MHIWCSAKCSKGAKISEWNMTRAEEHAYSCVALIVCVEVPLPICRCWTVWIKLHPGKIQQNAQLLWIPAIFPKSVPPLCVRWVLVWEGWWHCPIPHFPLCALRGAAARAHMACGTRRDVSEASLLLGFSFKGPSCSFWDPWEGCSWFVGCIKSALESQAKKHLVHVTCMCQGGQGLGWQHLAWQSRSGCALLGDSWDVGIHDSPPNQGLRSHRKKYLYHSDYWVPVALSVVSRQKENLVNSLM